MNVLPLEKQAQVISLLTEGCSIRSTERLTGVHRDTILRLLVRVGRGCDSLMDRTMRGLLCHRLQVDEAWCYVFKKEGHINGGDDPNQMGDFYIFVALDADTKVIPCYLVGKRTHENTMRFMKDLHQRVIGRPQLTTDGWGAYPEAVRYSFGWDVDFATQSKKYARDLEGEHRYSPPKVVGVRIAVFQGDPDPLFISTSYIERQNLTLRMHLRRLTRLTNGFSKTVRNLTAAVGLHLAFYNFVRVHQTLRVTPAMEARVTNHLWTVEELVEEALRREGAAA